MILQVVPKLWSGGVERGTVEIVQAITGDGGRALVASEGGPLVAAVTASGGRHFTLPLASKNPLRILRNATRLARLIRDEKVQLVHARSRAPAWSALLATRRTGARFLTTYHAPYDESRPGKRSYNAVMARGERVIAISQYIADLLRERHGILSGHIRVIPRGVDPAAFDPDAVAPERLTQLRQEWRVPEGGRVVLLPGRLARWKGHGVLIDALRWVRTSRLTCVFAGPLEDRDRFTGELKRQAEAVGVALSLRFAGQCDDMPAALMLADIVVNASTAPEGFGRTVIEAQAMARPVIATDHGGAVETVEHGVTGWRVPPGDPMALAVAIDQVFGLGAEALQAVGRCARASVLARYTTAAMQKATLAVYSELLP